MAFNGTVIGRGIIPVSFDPTALGKDIGGIGAVANTKLGAIGKVGGVALAAGVAIGVGTGLFKMGEEFDNAYDKIRVGTGATGKALIGLQADFKEVARTGPDSFDLVGTAVAELNQRLDLSGKPLRTLSRQVLDLSRITGTDLSTNIEAVSRVFGDWGVATGEQSGALDKLFRASQATGPSVDRLAVLMTKFGSPLRQLGFDFSTTAALVGKFEKEGVNTELVMGSMRIALSRMQREGEPVQETFKRVTEQIATTSDELEAGRLAADLFGAKAGPDMKAALQEGRFSIEDLYKTIENGKETIETATEDTSDFAEAWAEFKNELKVGAEPAATSFFDTLGKGMKWINEDGIPTVRRLNRALSNEDAPDRVEPMLLPGVENLAQRLGPMMDSAKKRMSEGWAAIRADTQSNLSSIGGTIKAWGSDARSSIGSTASGMKSRMSEGWAAMVTDAKSKGRRLKTTASDIGNDIVGALKSVPGKMRSLGGDIAEGLRSGLSSKFDQLKSWFSNKIGDLIAAAKDKLKSASPSRVFMEIGQSVGDGMAIGIEGTLPRVLGAVDGLASARPGSVRVPEFAASAGTGYGSGPVPVFMVNATDLDSRSRWIARGEIDDERNFRDGLGRMN